MQAAFIRETGPASNIIFGELPDPSAGPGQVRVKIKCVAVNPVDTYIRAGAIQMPLPFPFVVGCDLAGVVDQVGSGVSQFKVGDRVWGSNQGLLGRQGTFAEYAAVDANLVYPTPSNVTDEQAAATALVGITGHLGLVRDAQLKSGETLFINGGTGGVGSTVVQMAKILGARVIATVGSDAKKAACRELGADVVINYKDTDCDDQIRAAAPDGLDVWWETLREPNFDRTVGLLAKRGRMILMAGREARAPFPVGPFYVKGCTLKGFVMFLATPEEQQFCGRDINSWLASGRLKTLIGKRFKLAETAAAHELQEANTLKMQGTLQGKIVLTP